MGRVKIEIKCNKIKEDENYNIMTKGLISSKEIVEKFGIPYPTVTHYTNMGFFTVVMRKGNGRLYDESEIKAQLEKIRGLTNEGYPLRLIRKILVEGKNVTKEAG